MPALLVGIYTSTLLTEIRHCDISKWKGFRLWVAATSILRLTSHHWYIFPPYFCSISPCKHVTPRCFLLPYCDGCGCWRFILYRSFNFISEPALLSSCVNQSSSSYFTRNCPKRRTRTLVARCHRSQQHGQELKVEYAFHTILRRLRVSMGDLIVAMFFLPLVLELMWSHHQISPVSEIEICRRLGPSVRSILRLLAGPV